MVGSKQVQVLDLVLEFDTTTPKSTIVSCPLPPRKRPKILIDDISPEALIMPEPDIDHQVNKFKLNYFCECLSSFFQNFM